ncbi:MAG: class I SAM-dependent methyltransferase [Acidobacteriota bacterium]
MKSAPFGLLLGTVAELRKSWVRRKNRLRAGRFWGKHHSSSSATHAFWLGVDEVMAWVNLKVSGHPQIWPLSWFLMSLPPDQLPVRYALSIGCGEGSLEREVIRHEAALRVTGIDVSSKSLELASRLAGRAGYGDRLEYRRSAAEAWLAGGEGEDAIDLIFFHASLHHMEQLERVLSLCARRLVRGNPGLLYVDEYIGPSRDEWTEFDLRHSATLFERIPRRFRQQRSLRFPIAYEDPTEMIRSSEIEPLLRQHFEVTEYRPYYGNVLMPLVCGIRPEYLEDSRVRTVLREAMKLEDDLARQGAIDPIYAVFVARPKAPEGHSRTDSSSGFTDQMIRRTPPSSASP